MSFASRRRLALVVAVALIVAIAIPSTGLAKVKNMAPSAAAVSAQAYWAPDAYESADDTWTTAPTLPAVSYHTLESSPAYFPDTNDVDWAKVTITATGTPIFAETRRVGGGDFDTHMYLFAQATSSVMPTAVATAENDDHQYFATYAQDIYYVAPAPGTYWIKMQTHWDTSTDRDHVPDWEGTSCGYYTYIELGDARRIYGTDRYDTAINVTKNTWGCSDNYNYGDGPDEDTVILASGANYADALAASALAAGYDVPLLLTPPTALPANVLAEIERLAEYNFTQGDDFGVYICGGTAAVSTAVENALKASPRIDSVKRLAGTDRYGTAAAIADEASSVAGGLGKRVFLASGTSFADALAAGPVAGYAGNPILMSQPTTITSATVNWMKSNATTEVIVCGGPSAIATAVLDGIQASVPDTQTFVRLGGANRYETAYRLAQYGVTNFSMEGSSCILVSGENFPDGLAAAQIAYWTAQPILLTPAATLSPYVQTYYETNDGFAMQNYVVGGPSAISNAAFASMRDLWKKPF